MGNTIDDILEKRRAEETPQEEEGAKFYSTIVTEGFEENFLEFRLSNGTKLCFNYTDLTWFNHDPETGMLDLAFGEFMVSIKGRGLGDRLFHAIKSKRVAWVKEADSDFEDNDENETYIAEIAILPPEGFGAEEENDGLE